MSGARRVLERQEDVVGGQDGWHLAGDRSGHDREIGCQCDIGREDYNAAVLRVLPVLVQDTVYEDDVRVTNGGWGPAAPALLILVRLGP